MGRTRGGSPPAPGGADGSGHRHVASTSRPMDGLVYAYMPMFPPWPSPTGHRGERGPPTHMTRPKAPPSHPYALEDHGRHSGVGHPRARSENKIILLLLLLFFFVFIFLTKIHFARRLKIFCSKLICVFFFEPKMISEIIFLV